MRRFEYIEGTSAKFWEIDRTDGSVEFTVVWGRIGTAGQTQTKSFASPEKATLEYTKLIAEKVKKGYGEVAAAASSGNAAPKPKVPTPKPQPVVKSEEPSTTPSEAEVADEAAPADTDQPGVVAAVPAVELPDPADEDQLFWTAELALRTWASRGSERASGTRPLRTVEAATKALARDYQYRVGNAAATVEAALSPGASVAQMAELLNLVPAYAEPIALVHGVAATMEALALVQPSQYHPGMYGVEQLVRLGDRIACAPNPEYLGWVEAARTIEKKSGRPLTFLAFLFPTEDFATPLADRSSDPDLMHVRSAMPTAATAYELHGYSYGSTTKCTNAHALLHRFGLDAVPLLIETPVDIGDWSKNRDELLAHCGTDQAFSALIAHMDEKNAQSALMRACEFQPHRGVRLLSVVRGKNESLAQLRLKTIERRWPGILRHHLASASGDSARMLRSIVDAVTVAEADATTLPPVLQSPPWKGKRTRLEQPVLDVTVPAPEPTIAWKPGEKQKLTAGYDWSPFRHHGSKAANRKAMEQSIAAPTIEPGYLHYLDSDLQSQALQRDPNMSGWQIAVDISRIAAKHGLEALPFLVKCANAAPGKSITALAAVGSVELAPAAATAFSLKSAKRAGLAWLFRHPDHAIAGLIPSALTKPGKTRVVAERALRMLAAGGSRDEILAAAFAAGDDVGNAITLALDCDPLAILPAKIPSPPSWCSLAGLAPLLLQKGGGRVPEFAVETVLVMLQISTPDEPYAGLDIVSEAITPASLEAFSWSVFESWRGAGYPKDGGWTLTQLGVLGGDHAARQLAPYIRVWPGEAAHARAVTGLDVLAAIGTDVSLMHLNRISETAKFKGLKENAKERITAIAESRGLTQEELADRLVPDLGLDSDGSLSLDFGPRRFRVGFDELLAPTVRDEAGAVLRSLPKPNAKDDPEKAKAASDRWKALKKDATEASKVQMRRIELAMSIRRRWDAATFQLVFVDHPLMFHVARRLVWSVFDADDRVVASFRIAEDRTLANADDDTFVLPETTEDNGLRIGIPHPMQLDDATLAAFGNVFADYEILQPFPQLGRDRFVLTDDEGKKKKLERFTDIRCHFGKILALEYKGWQKGAPQDAGVVHTMAKPLSDGRWIQLQLTEGLWVGLMSETPEQNLGPLFIVDESDSWTNEGIAAFASVDPVEMSEVLRDFELMR
jgi:predicted DNA-binding WGR domain protein